MTPTRTEGNVIHADFGRRAGHEVPLGTASVRVLYEDAEVLLARTEITIGGETWVTHGLYPAPRSGQPDD